MKEEDDDSFARRLSSSFINETDTSPWYVKAMRKIDIFSFIPVPKDEPVSTKRSLCGSTLFFLIFVAYILYDFIFSFLLNNPPIIQNYYTPIDQNDYPVPDFGILFMEGLKLNIS